MATQITTPHLLFPTYLRGQWKPSMTSESLMDKNSAELFEITNDCFAQYEELGHALLSTPFDELIETHKKKFQAKILKETDPIAQKTALIQLIIRPSQQLMNAKIEFFNTYGLAAFLQLKQSERQAAEILTQAESSPPLDATNTDFSSNLSEHYENIHTSTPSKPALQAPLEKMTPDDGSSRKKSPFFHQEQAGETFNEPTEQTIATTRPLDRNTKKLIPALAVGVSLLITAVVLYSKSDPVQSFCVQMGFMEAPEASSRTPLEEIYHFFFGKA